MKKHFLRVLLKKESLTDKLLKLVDDYEIYSSLIETDVELGETISSPIRASDDNPSFTLYVPTRLIEKGYSIRPEELWFKDLADGRYGDVFRFVKYFAFHNYGLSLSNRYQIVQFIDNQLGLDLLDNKKNL